MSCNDEKTGQLIGSYELGLLSEQERKSFEAHVLKCDHCFQDLYRTSPVVSAMKTGGAATVLAGAGHRRWRAWSLMVGAAAVVLLLVYVGGTFGPEEPQERLRGTEQGSVVVFAPIGEVPVPAELDWKIVPPAVSYRVTIQTPAGEAIWEATVQPPPVTLPESVRALLKPGESYFWKVEAIGEDGQNWSSPQTKFTLED